MTGDLHFIWYSINICVAEYHNENMVNFRTPKSPLENTFTSKYHDIHLFKTIKWMQMCVSVDTHLEFK